MTSQISRMQHVFQKFVSQSWNKFAYTFHSSLGNSIKAEFSFWLYAQSFSSHPAYPHQSFSQPGQLLTTVHNCSCEIYRRELRNWYLKVSNRFLLQTSISTAILDLLGSPVTRRTTSKESNLHIFQLENFVYVLTAVPTSIFNLIIEAKWNLKLWLHGWISISIECLVGLEWARQMLLKGYFW